MKQSSYAPRLVVRTLALVAGVLGVAFVAAPPAAEARGIPAPHEVVRDVHRLARNHVRRVSRLVDHSVRHGDGYRHARIHHSRYYRPSYRYPVVVGGYRPYRSYNDFGYVRGYVGVPSVGIVVGVRPDRRYRDDDCDRDRYRDDDRRRYDDDDDYDDYDD
jgi:hypothetical protein